MGKYALVVALLVGLSDSAFARDDGRYANELLKNWFDNLTSSNGKCCSFADGFSVTSLPSTKGLWSLVGSTPSVRATSTRVRH